MKIRRSASIVGVLSTGIALTCATSAGSFAVAAEVPDLVRVSVSNDGRLADSPAGAPVNEHPAVGAGGRLVAFESSATNLVAGDTNNAADVFVRDVVAGTTRRVSVSDGGGQGNASSRRPSISADGRYVAFRSDAANLVPDDTNAVSDMFVRDLVAGATVRVSLSGTGQQGDRTVSSGPTRISADGRYVTFASHATNLVDGDTNDAIDLFVRDLLAATTTRVNVATGTGQQAGDSEQGVEMQVSAVAAGRYVAFGSRATTLVPGDTNNSTDVFVRDIVAGTTTRVSVSTAGAQSFAPTGAVAISADGRRVVFNSAGANLVAGDTNNLPDVFLHDMVTGTTSLVSVPSAEVPHHGGYDPSISADGQRVAYMGFADGFPGGDGVLVRNLATGATTRIDGPRPGTVEEAVSRSTRPTISADGGFVAFTSSDDSLIAGGTRGDVFLRRLAG